MLSSGKLSPGASESLRSTRFYGRVPRLYIILVPAPLPVPRSTAHDGSPPPFRTGYGCADSVWCEYRSHPSSQIVGHLVLPDDSCRQDRKSTRLNSSHVAISYAVFCLQKKKIQKNVHKRLIHP